MAIRLTKQAWDAIRSEYLKGATATELAERCGSVKAASIHARAVRERWREIAIPANSISSHYAAIRAKATGVSVAEASEMEAIAQHRLIASHREEVAFLGQLLKDGLMLASDASKESDAKLAQSAAELISSVNEAAAGLYLKMQTDRIAYGLDPCQPFAAVTGEIYDTSAKQAESEGEAILETL
jgi:hypothetical protein